VLRDTRPSSAANCAGRSVPARHRQRRSAAGRRRRPSSDFPTEFDPLIKAANPWLNPQVKYFDGSRRGYLRMTIDRSQWLTEARIVA